MIHATIIGEMMRAAPVARGCPQGGVLSPFLWNLVMKGLVMILKSNEHKTLGYVNDTVNMVQDKYNTRVRDRWQI